MEVMGGVTRLDVERFLYSPPNDSSSSSGSEDLPIIGTSALEQILCPSSPSSISTTSSSPSLHDMERMSPDSTMEFTRSHNGNPYQNCSEQALIENSPPIIAQPDSTTQDLSNYNSDEFDSDDSCDSSFDMQEGNRPYHNAPTQNGSSFMQQTHQKQSNSLLGSHPQVGANVHQPHPTPSPQNLDLIYNSSSYNGVQEDQKNINNNNNNNHMPIKKKKKKKSKRAGDVTLTCNLCDYTTRYKEHLTSHMHTHDPSRNYMCSDCGQTFKWSHSLKRHQNSAHKMDPDHRYTCKYCMKTFSRKDHLSIHENLHTSSGVTHPCTECGATFKNKKTLTGHIKTHTSQKAFKCGQCDSEFTRRASLNRHVKAAHEGQTIKCPDCTLVFSYRSTLEDHKKAAHNEGKREFECELCGQDFAVKAYLSKHMVTCRNRKVGKTYSCHLCTKKGFLSKLRLAEHEKRKHPTVVVTSVVHGGNVSLTSSPTTSPSQSDILKMRETQTSTNQTIPPMTCRPPSNTSSSESSILQATSYSNANMTSPITPHMTPTSTSIQKHWDGSGYFNAPNSIHQNSLIPSSYPTQQTHQGYMSPHHLNNYGTYGIQSSIPSPSGNSCHIQSSPSYQQPLSTPSLIGHQQHPLPPMGSENIPVTAHHGEENVGSLLRLVYSCPDSNLESSYHMNSHNYVQPNHHLMDQTHSAKLNPQTVNLNNACLMSDYPQLDNEMSRGVCFDWDSYTKIDCKN